MGRDGPTALHGKETTARVLIAAGPYRLSGEWWRQEQQDDNGQGNDVTAGWAVDVVEVALLNVLGAVAVCLVDKHLEAVGIRVHQRAVHPHPASGRELDGEHADRLRRCQQPKPARALLIDALDTFERLRSTVWAVRVSAELRTGSQSGAGPRADPFAELSPQQVQIARLAGHNRTATTELVYRHELRPVITTGAEVMDRILDSPMQ